MRFQEYLAGFRGFGNLAVLKSTDFNALSLLSPGDEHVRSDIHPIKLFLAEPQLYYIKRKSSRGNIPKCHAPISFVHTPLDTGHRVDKRTKRISVEDFSFGTYGCCTEFWAYGKRFPKKQIQKFQSEFFSIDRSQ
jgi:hypothetical protein